VTFACSFPGLEEFVTEHREAALAEARAKMAWDSEAAALRLAKLRTFFHDQLAQEHVALHPFGNGSPLTTFRLPELPPSVQVQSN
jgi:hypothetical protein